MTAQDFDDFATALNAAFTPNEALQNAMKRARGQACLKNNFSIQTTMIVMAFTSGVGELDAYLRYILTSRFFGEANFNRRKALVLLPGGATMSENETVTPDAMEPIPISTGEVDPSRAFGIATDARAGFSHLSVLVEVGSELSCNEKGGCKIVCVNGH
jgi:hypothetical protein